MAIVVDIHFDMQKLARELREFSARTGITIDDVCNEQMRLACNSLMHEPKSFSYGQRKKNVVADLNRIFTDEKDTGKIEREFNVPGFGIALKVTDKESPFLIPAQNLMSSQAEMHEVHMRTRRMYHGRLRVISLWTNKGKHNGLPISNIRLVDRAMLKNYVSFIQSRIGTLAAGWWNSAVKYAALAHGVVKAPRWVQSATRKLGYSGGSMHGGSGEIYAVNDVPWADQSLMSYYAEKESRNRQADIDNHAMKRIDQLERRFNSAHAA